MRDIDTVYYLISSMDGAMYEVMSTNIPKAPLVSFLLVVWNEELNARGYPWRARFAEWIERFAIRHAKGVFCVTPELCMYFSKKYNYPLEATCFIPNGVSLLNLIDPSEARKWLLEKACLEAKDNKIVASGILAAISEWHGLERISKFIIKLNRPNIHIFLFGFDSVPSSWETSGNRIHPMGWIPENLLGHWLPGLDFGFGSFNLEIRELSQDPSLKVATFLLMGVPVVLRAEDPRIEESQPFALKLPVGDEKLEVEALQSFIHKVMRERESIRIAARNFALRYLNWDRLSEDTLDFMAWTIYEKDSPQKVVL